MRLIQNSTWQNPTPDLSLLFSLIIVTLLVECGFVYLYAKNKNYSHIGELLVVIVAVNWVTGLIGFLIGMFSI